MISLRKSGPTLGIEKCHPAELPAEFYRMINRWTGVVDGQQVTVYAGALRHNPAKGVLVLRRLPADMRRIAGKHCAVPANSGALKVVENRGSRLRIAMANGGHFWFEIPRGLRKAA